MQRVRRKIWKLTVSRSWQSCHVKSKYDSDYDSQSSTDVSTNFSKFENNLHDDWEDDNSSSGDDLFQAICDASEAHSDCDCETEVEQLLLWMPSRAWKKKKHQARSTLKTISARVVSARSTRRSYMILKWQLRSRSANLSRSRVSYVCSKPIPLITKWRAHDPHSM